MFLLGVGSGISTPKKEAELGLRALEAFIFLTGLQGGRRGRYRATSGPTSPDPWPLASLCSRLFFRWSSRRSRSNSFMRFT